MAEDTAPLVSIIIPFFNRPQEVEPCLSRILAQSAPFPFEVIAVDNNSTDDTGARLREFPVRVVDCAVKGPAAARNAGARIARGRILVFVDSDCSVRRGWLERLVRPFVEDESLTIVGGGIRAARIDTGAEYFSDGYGVLDQALFFRGGFLAPPFVATANAALRSEDFARAGGFDEALRVGEDADLCWRILAPGGKLVYVPGAWVRHAHRRTFRELFRQARSYGAGSVAVFAKHRDSFRRRVLIDWDLWLLLPLLPWYAITEYRRQAARGAHAWQLYEALWLAGLVLGRVEGSLRHRVVYL